MTLRELTKEQELQLRREFRMKEDEFQGERFLYVLRVGSGREHTDYFDAWDLMNSESFFQRVSRGPWYQNIVGYIDSLLVVDETIGT